MQDSQEFSLYLSAVHGEHVVFGATEHQSMYFDTAGIYGTPEMKFMKG